MKSFAVLAFAGLQNSWAQSISSCGKPGDHASNVQMSISPDPIRRGKPFTFSAAFDLDEDITGGSIDIDMTGSAFGLLSTNTESMDFKLSDGLVKKGTGMKVTVGPIKLPNIFGVTVIKGTVKVTNEKGEGVTCVNLDINVPWLGETPLLDETEPKLEEKGQDTPAGLTICSKPADHIKHLKIDEAADMSVTITGTFDEAISAFNVQAALKFKIGPYAPIPFRVHVPVKLTNIASPVGDFLIYTSAPKNLKSTTHSKNPIGKITGEIIATDTKGGLLHWPGILCLDTTIAASTETIVV